MKHNLVMTFCAMALCASALAAPLGTSTRTVLPVHIQQVISVDYRALRNSPSGIALKSQVLPDNLKAFETSLKGLGVNPNTDVEQLTFVAYRTIKGKQSTFGVASGQFDTKKIVARLKVKKLQSVKYRDSILWPAGGSFVVTLLDDNTMLFGESSAVKDGLDVRDGEMPGIATTPGMLQSVVAAERGEVWSVLDQLGTQNMLRSALGEAASLADFDAVKQRIETARYTLDLQHGVDFVLTVQTSDAFTAGTVATLMKAGILYKKTSGTVAEKSAMDDMNVDSDNGSLIVKFKAEDSKFQSLLKSDLFQAVAK
jgi:hypothetical protein